MDETPKVYINMTSTEAQIVFNALTKEISTLQDRISKDRLEYLAERDRLCRVNDELREQIEGSE